MNTLKHLFICLLLTLGISNAYSIEVYLYSPSQNQTIEVGESITFSIGADDPNGLKISEWYVGSSHITSHNLSGYYAEDSWTRTFNSAGTFYVYAYVFNVNNQEDFVWWKVVVEAPPCPDLRVNRIWTEPSNPVVGEEVDLYAEIINTGDGVVTNRVTLDYYINGSYVDDDYFDDDLSKNQTITERETNYVFSNPGTYTYRVDVHNYSGECSTSNNDRQISITVSPQPIGNVAITSPNGGESWEAGTTQNISWNYSGNISTIDLQYTTNNGSSWTHISSPSLNSSPYSWNVPSIINSTQCRVKVIGYYNSEFDYDISNSVFSIQPPSVGAVSLISPSGGENWLENEEHSISWNYSGNISSVDLQYSIDNGESWSHIDSPDKDFGSYPWTVPNGINSNYCLIKIIGYYNSDYTVDVSNLFTIQEEPIGNISLLSPNGGEEFEAGSIQNITWNHSGNITSMDIQYTTDWGESWEYIASPNVMEGSYEWGIPKNISGIESCRVKLIGYFNEQEVFSISQQVFSIENLSQSSLHFSGMTWYISNYSGNPGPNVFSNSSKSVWVDENGDLHMKIRKLVDGWNCVQLETSDFTGYGKYTVKVKSNYENLDPNVVAAFYTYWDNQGEIEELDIEFSQWSDPNAMYGQYLVQPTNGDQSRIFRFDSHLTGTYTTHQFNWARDNVYFKSWHGHEIFSTNETEIASWTFSGSDIPVPGDERLMLNLWLNNGLEPMNGQEVEFIIHSVEVQNTGNAEIKVSENSNFVAGAEVRAYLSDSDSQSAITDASGSVLMNLPLGNDLYFDVFNQEVENENKELWSSSQVVFDDQTLTYSEAVERSYPFIGSIAGRIGQKYFDISNDDLTPGTIVEMLLYLNNNYPQTFNTRVSLYLDQNMDATYDFESNMITHDAPSGVSTISIPVNIDESWAGQSLYVKAKVEAYINSQWIQTDLIEFNEYNWRWDVNNNFDNTPPVLIVDNLVPKNNDTIDPVIINEVGIYLEFSEPIDESTLSNSTFVLLDDQNNSITGTFDFSLGESSAYYFKPLQDLSYGRQYSYSVLTGVKDRSGNNLSHTYQVLFNTIEAQSNSITLLGALAELANADNSGSLREQYSNNKKRYAYFESSLHIGFGLGAIILFDLSDYYSAMYPSNPLTEEGANGWITTYIDASAGAGIGLEGGMGITPYIDFTPPLYDRKNYWEVSGISATIPFIQTTGISVSNNGEDWGIVNTQPVLGLSASIISGGTNLIRLEIQKDVIDDIIRDSFSAMTGYVNPSSIINCTNNFLGQIINYHDTWKVFANISSGIRPFTVMDNIVDINEIEYDGVINHVRGGRDTNNDNIPDNLFSTLPYLNIIGFEFSDGWSTEVCFSNLGNDVEDFIIKVKDVPNDWIYGCFDREGRLIDLWDGAGDHDFDVYDIAPSSTGHEENNVQFLFNPKKNAQEEIVVTFELYRRTPWYQKNVLLHTLTDTLRAYNHISNIVDPEIEFTKPIADLTIELESDLIDVEIDVSKFDKYTILSLVLDQDNGLTPWDGINEYLIYSDQIISSNNILKLALPKGIPNGVYSLWANVYNGTYNYYKLSEYTVNIDRPIIPSTPELFSPDDETILSNVVPTFTWSEYYSPIGLEQKGYQLRVRSDDDGDKIVYDTGLILESSQNHVYNAGAYIGYDDVSETNRISDQLEVGKKYHWHVRFMDVNGSWSKWAADTPSTHYDFYTSISTQVNKVYKDVKVDVYPNPSNGEVYINFSCDFHELTSIKVFDARGRLVSNNKYENLSANIHYLVNLGGFTDSIYYIHIINPKINKVLKVVKN